MKKIIHNLSNVFADFFTRRPVVIMISILAAVVIWFAIVMKVYPSTPVRFYNIPVQIDTTGTNAEANGLSVVDNEVQTVSVELVGNRSQIGLLTAEDLVATADLGAISASGQYTLNLDVHATNGITFDVRSITPTTTNVKLDKIETRTFDVEASFPNVVVTSGHVLDMEDVSCEPSSIEITGPSAQLAEIGKVVVYSNKSTEISSSYSLYSSDVQLYTNDGARLDAENLTIPSVDFQISIPILTQKELALTYDLIGTPSGFDQDWLHEHLKLSEDSITLASQTSSAFADKDSLSVDYVRLSEVGLDYSDTMDITLTDEYINMSGIQQVTLTLDSEGLSSRTFTVDKDNISIINQPTGYNFGLVTDKLSVTIVGEAESIENIDSDDIIVTVDLLNYDVESNASESFLWQANISFYQYDRVWALGTYRISLNRTSAADLDLNEE